MALLYLALRIYLGYVWLQEGVPKLGDRNWMVTGETVQTFWRRAVVVPEPPVHPAVHFGWYRDFLRRLLEAQAHTWLAPLLVLSELATGASLLLGLFTRAAALAGLIQNLNFALAGGRGHNPFMLIAQTVLLFAPSDPGRLGLDGLLSRGAD